MRYSKSSSWAVSLRLTSQGLLTALYIREAAALAPNMDYYLPALDERVNSHAMGSASERAAAEEQWRLLWGRLIDGDETLRGLIAPEFTALTGMPEMLVITASLYDEARQFSGERKRRASIEWSAGSLLDFEGKAVRNLERGRGQPAGPFKLEIVELPVVGRWFVRSDKGRLLVSTRLRRDLKAYLDVLRPIIIELM